MSVTYAFDIYPAATPNGTLLVRLTTSEGVELSCKKVLHGTGEGTIRIHSSHPDATTTNFAKRNYVKVIAINGATETPFFGFFLEQGDFGAISRREQGGRMLKFEGLGSLFYLDRALLLAEIYAPGQPRRGNLVIDGSWGWNDVPYGAILVRALEEGIYAPGSPLADATADFTRDDDSDGNPWPNIDNEYIVPWGTSVYEVVANFIKLGLIVTADADLTFHAWQSYGTNRTSATFAAGKVRYEHGVNIGNEVTRQIRASLERSHIFVTGDEFTSTVVDGGSSAVTYYDTLPRQETNDPATLTAAGERDLTQREIQADAAFPVRVIIDDDELNGLYVPGEHYDVGDIVTIDTVPPSGASGDHDYVNFAIEVAAIKLEHDDAGNWFAVNELGAQYLTAQLSAFEVASNRVINQIELCRASVAGVPILQDSAYDSNTASGGVTPPTGADAVIAYTDRATSDPATTISYGGVAMTLLKTVTHNVAIPGRADFVQGQFWIATNVTPGVMQFFTFGGGAYYGHMFISGYVSTTDGGSAMADSSTASGTVTGSGGIPVVGLSAFKIGGTDGADPVADAPATTQWSVNAPTGLGIHDFGMFTGDSSPSIPLAGTTPWLLSFLWLNGSSIEGAGPVEIVGTSIHAARCDHNHEVEDLLTSETDTSLRLAPDGVGGVEWGSGGAPTTADYLVGTAQAGLSAEIVVGTTPGGELGNTWASPTVDATHAGSNHLQPVRKNSTGSVFTRRQLNFIEGSNVTLTVADDAGNDEVDITIASSGGSGVAVEEDGTEEGTGIDRFDFTTGLNVSVSGTQATISADAGGGITHSYIGYDTIGGSTENIVDLRQYMKQVTTASDGLLASIGVYVKQITAGLIFACRVAVLTDSGGAPDDIIAQGPGPNDGLFLSNSNASAGDARWLHSPVGVWLPAGTYWLAVMFHPQSAASHNIYYDGSGADRYFTNGGWRITDSGWTSVTTSSNKYSIRGSLIS